MKHDHQAIFGPGRHPLSIDDMRTILVQPFPATRRFDLYAAFYSLVSELKACQVRCEIWIDGSFVTYKLEPDDIDFTIMIDATEFDTLDENGKSLLERLGHAEEKYLGCLDCFLCIVYPKGDPKRRDDPPEDWAKQWSIEHNERYLKGFAVMQVET